MHNTPMIDREIYRKIKKMSREEIQGFLMRPFLRTRTSVLLTFLLSRQS